MRKLKAKISAMMILEAHGIRSKSVVAGDLWNRNRKQLLEERFRDFRESKLSGRKGFLYFLFYAGLNLKGDFFRNFCFLVTNERDQVRSLIDEERKAKFCTLT